MDAGAGNSRGDKGKAKVSYEEKRKRSGDTRRNGRGKEKKGPKSKGEDGRKWSPGDPLPNHPTPTQIEAHNRFMIRRFLQAFRPEEGRDFTEVPEYKVLLDSCVLPPDDEVPEGAEIQKVVDDLDNLFSSSSVSSDSTSDEASSSD